MLRALKSLPMGSDACMKTYDHVLRLIESQPEEDRELAGQVLWWIFCSKRRLTATELQHAIAVEVGESYLDPQNLTSVQDMVSCCAGLVTLDEETNVIRLVHYTAQE